MTANPAWLCWGGLASPSPGFGVRGQAGPRFDFARFEVIKSSRGPGPGFRVGGPAGPSFSVVGLKWYSSPAPPALHPPPCTPGPGLP